MLDEDIVVEVNYVFLFIRRIVDLHVNVIDLFRGLKKLTKFGDDHVKCDGKAWLNFTHAIDGAHYHLINHSVYEQMSLCRELNLHDSPDFFTDIIIQVEGLTQLHDSLGCNLQESLEKYVVRLEVPVIFNCRLGVCFLAFN